MYPETHAAITPDKPADIMAGSGRILTYREWPLPTRQVDDPGADAIAMLLRRCTYSAEPW